MKLKQFVDEDFINYRKTSLFLGTSKCDGKCYRDLGLTSSICQNHDLQIAPIMEMRDVDIINRYLDNPLTHAIVIGGLEPLMDPEEILEFISTLRIDFQCEDDVVIYTGYYENEVKDFINRVSKYSNIIIKFGRYIPDQTEHYDPVLGVNLASGNQYAKKIC